MIADAGLERRYRRLLAWYPAEHRRVYEDEMLGVLLAGARPQQRYPGLRESANLAFAAASLRLGSVGAGLTDSRWTDATAVVGMLASVLLLAKQVRPVADALGWLLRVDDRMAVTQPAATWLRIAVWTAVTVAVLCGWRLVAAMGAWVAVLGEVIVLAIRNTGYPTNLMPASWQLPLAAIAATALSIPGGARGSTVLGWRRVAVLGVGGAIAAIAPMAIPFFAEVTPPAAQGSDAFSFVASIEQRRVALVALLTYAAVAVLTLAAIAQIAPPIRRRVLTLLTPTVTLLTVIQVRAGYPFSGAINPLPITGPVYSALLVTAPLLVFLTSLVIVRRRERTEPS
jgi:hypothetical protein